MKLNSSQSRAQLSVLSLKTLEPQCWFLPRFCLSSDRHPFVSLRQTLSYQICGQSAVLVIMAPCWASLSLLGKWTNKLSFYFFLSSFFPPFWKQTVVLCECVWICIFLLCPDLFIKRKTHLHKKASEHRKNVYFVFLSVAPRHAGFWLPLRDFEDWLSSQTRLFPPTGKLSFVGGGGLNVFI